MKLFFSLLSLLSPLLLAGCFFSNQISASPATREQREEYYGISGTTSSGLEFDSLNYLQSSLLIELYRERSDFLIRKLDADYKRTKEPELLAVKADVCYNYARKTDDPDMANRYFLSAAAAYFQILFETKADLQCSNRFDPRVLRSTIRYNACIGHIFSYVKERGLLMKRMYHLPGADQETFFFPEFPLFELPQKKEDCAELLLCSDFKAQKLMHFSYHFGLGAPIIVQSRNTEEKAAPLKLAKDLAIPATCLLRFQRQKDGSLHARLEFHNSVEKDWVRIQKENVPLTRDYSTPLAYFLGRRRNVNLLLYMLMPYKESFSGLYAMSPYDPNKIPVIFVHGLMSSPQTWIQMINTMYSDPVIRKNYQFWFYTYSSGNPVPVSAMRMRNTVDRVRDLHGTDPRFNKMVIVGHSMGGLLTKTFVMDSGDSILSERIGKPWKEVRPKLKQETAERLEKLLVLKPRDYVARIVFMAVPHKGSSMADGGIARLGANLIRLPVAMVTEMTSLAAQLIPGNEKNAQRKIISTGIDNLSPDNPMISILARQKLSPKVNYHSIIGNNRKEGVPGGSDGVVPYDSSHLDFVDSELIVKSGHSVQEKPETIRELIRILHLHLRQNGGMKE